MSKIGNSSGKYDYEPWKIDEDIKNIKETQNQFKRDLEKVLYKKYKYDDGGVMSRDVKRTILIDVHKEFIGVD